MERTELYKISETAKLLRVSKLFVYAAVQTGTIPSVWMGRHRFIARAVVEKLLRDGLPSQFSRSKN